MLAFLVAVGLSHAAPFNFLNKPPYASSIPTPESILHYRPGERHTTFREQEMVMQAISASAKNKVRVVQYGSTAEGRPLRIYIIGSPEHIAALPSIQRDHQRIAKGEGNASEVVPIVWINECIHGDETASFESAMWTFYNLVASQSSEITDALKNSVVILNPVYNPDGHERYVVYYNSIATGSSEPDAFEKREPQVIYGRTNHFRFDLNRDRIAFSQPETQAEFAEMLQWNPQVYIDQHGQVASYFFPPEPESININVDRERNAKWTDYFGRETGKSFDRQGMSYFVKDTFDLYYPGYLDSSNTLSGAIGMTHETDGGRVIAQKRADGSVLTLAQGMSKHYTSALAVVEAAAAKHKDLMEDYAAFKKRAVSGQSLGKFQRVVLTSDDPRPLERLRKHLERAGINSYFTHPFTAGDAHDYWSATSGKVSFTGHVLVVDLAQPEGAFGKALLEPQSNFEAEFIKNQVAKKKTAPDGEKYPGPDSADFYDFTGWSLPYAYNIKSWWCESAPGLQPLTEKDHSPKDFKSSPIGYALRYSDQDDILAVFDALGSGARAELTNKSMKLGEINFEKGTFLFLAGRNEDDYSKILEKVAQKHSVKFEPLSSSYPEEGKNGPGSESVSVLRKPSIAVVMGNGDRLSECGATWFLLERTFGLPFTFISESGMEEESLNSFTCVIVPSRSTISKSDNFKSWLRRGNVAIVLGDTGSVISYQDLADVKGDIQELPGSLFKANMDLRSFLTYGYQSSTIAVPIEGNHFYTRRKEGGSIVTLSPDEKEKKLLSGWEWPDDTEKNLKDALFLQDIQVGEGHLVLYTQDPTGRAMWPGLYKTLLNAILLGSAQ